MRILWKYLKDYKIQTVLAPALKMLEAVLELFVPVIMAAVIDVGIANGDMPFIRSRCLLLVLLAVAGLGVSVTAQYFSAVAASGFAAKLRKALFGRIQELSFPSLDGTGVSTLVTRMTSDVNQVQTGVNMVLRLLLRSPFVVLGAMVMAFVINARMALIFVVVIPALGLAVYLIMRHNIPRYRKVQGQLDLLLGKTRENLSGVRVIRAFGKEAQLEEEFQGENRALLAGQLGVGRVAGLLNPVTFVIVNLGIAAILMAGGRQTYAGLLTQGEVVALVNYMSQVLVELVKFANLMITLTRAIACGKRIAGVLELPSEEEERAAEAGLAREEQDAGGFDQRNAVRERQGAKTTEAAAPWAAAGKSGEKERAGERTGEKKYAAAGGGEEEPAGIKVEFRHVSFAYAPGTANALEDITFQAAAGETVGIIGGTGSGKTTLVHLIAGFYLPGRGEVFVDGRPTREYRQPVLRQKIGIVMQQAWLFAGTIRENILFGKKDATDAEIMEALRTAQADGFVMEKPRGLDSFVEQGGRNFSGGQKQRLAVARALVRRPEILILDDSSSALDYATDAAMRRGIEGFRQPVPDAGSRMTVFIVAQRTSSLQHADKIIVLDRGKAVGLGTHEELLHNCPVYREIYESQNKDFALLHPSAGLSADGGNPKNPGERLQKGDLRPQQPDGNRQKTGRLQQPDAGLPAGNQNNMAGGAAYGQ